MLLRQTERRMKGSAHIFSSQTLSETKGVTSAPTASQSTACVGSSSACRRCQALQQVLRRVELVDVHGSPPGGSKTLVVAACRLPGLPSSALTCLCLPNLLCQPC